MFILSKTVFSFELHTGDSVFKDANLLTHSSPSHIEFFLDMHLAG